MSKAYDYFTNNNFGKSNIQKQYNTIKEYHQKFLKKHNVKLPKLIYRDNYSKSALVLIYLSYNYPNTLIVQKDELTKFIKHFHPNISDVQQARHLAAQDGWYIESGTRGDKTSLPHSSYKLKTLEDYYPGFTHGKRDHTNLNWEELKEKYNYRCATCGSKEGEKNFHWTNRVTTLQKGHMDPNKPLTNDNTIPQCDSCNRADLDKWIYDEKGRVRALANPKYINSSDINVQKEVFDILNKKFNKNTNN